MLAHIRCSIFFSCGCSWGGKKTSKDTPGDAPCLYRTLEKHISKSRFGKIGLPRIPKSLERYVICLFRLDYFRWSGNEQRNQRQCSFPLDFRTNANIKNKKGFDGKKFRSVKDSIPAKGKPFQKVGTQSREPDSKIFFDMVAELPGNHSICCSRQMRSLARPPVGLLVLTCTKPFATTFTNDMEVTDVIQIQSFFLSFHFYIFYPFRHA